MERGLTDAKKRLFSVTAGNLRQNHLYVHKHYDFFPSECVGSPKKRGNRNGHQIEIFLEGLNETITTDIGSDAVTHKPRGFFRGRTWVRRFFEHHGIRAGDVLALERLGTRSYRLFIDSRVASAKNPIAAGQAISGPC